MKKEVLNNEQYDSVYNMLSSSDDANRLMGFQVLENIDFNKSLTKVLLLKKTCNLNGDDWKENAPKTARKLKQYGELSSVLTYKQILKIIVDTKQPEEEIQFFLDKFSTHLTNSIKNLGFDFIEETEITIKLKKNDKARITSKSL